MNALLKSLTVDEFMACRAYRCTPLAQLPDQQRDIISSLAARYPEELFNGGLQVPSHSADVSQMSTNSLPSTPGMLSTRQFQGWEASHWHGHGRGRGRHDADSVFYHDGDVQATAESERAASEDNSVPLSRRDAWSIPSTPSRLPMHRFHEWEALHGDVIQPQTQHQHQQSWGHGQLPMSSPLPAVALSRALQMQPQPQHHQQYLPSTTPSRAVPTASTVAGDTPGIGHQQEAPFLARDRHTSSPGAVDVAPRPSPATLARGFPPGHPGAAGGAGAGATSRHHTHCLRRLGCHTVTAGPRPSPGCTGSFQNEVDALELAGISWADAMHRAVDLEQEQERRLARCELLSRRLEHLTGA